MANMYNYIEKYKNYSFDEKEFNDVDNIILSALSYISFDKIVSTKKQYITLKEASEIFLKKYTYKEYAKFGIAQKEAYKMLKILKDTKRFSNVLLYNYCYIGDDIQQFSAICIKIKKDLIYVSYEGTDHLMIGWKEDFALAYKFPVETQISAINYLNKAISIFDKNVIVGGHSKGGNLALVSSMYCKKRIRKKIIKIYNNDGPGLRKKEIESDEYQKIKDRLVHIIPSYCIVGLLFRHSNDYFVVESSRKDILAHSLATWQIDDDKLKEGKLNKLSINLDKSIIIWLDEHNDEQRKNLIDPVFEAINNANITNIYDVKSMKSIINVFRNLNGLDKSTKELISNFISFNLKYCFDNRK